MLENQNIIPLKKLTAKQLLHLGLSVMSQIDGHVSVVEMTSKIQSLMVFVDWTQHDSKLAIDLYFLELAKGGIVGVKNTFLSQLRHADEDTQRFVIQEILKLAHSDKSFLDSESDFFKECHKLCDFDKNSD